MADIYWNISSANGKLIGIALARLPLRARVSAGEVIAYITIIKSLAGLKSSSFLSSNFARSENFTADRLDCELSTFSWKVYGERANKISRQTWNDCLIATREMGEPAFGRIETSLILALQRTEKLLHRQVIVLRHNQTLWWVEDDERMNNSPCWSLPGTQLHFLLLSTASVVDETQQHLMIW